MIRAAGIGAALLLLLAAGSAQALTLQPVGDFSQPIYVTSDPGDPDRLFVAERGGSIVLVEDGARTVFADLSSQIQCPSGCAGSERGLASIALAPDFDTSGRLYVDYANYLDGRIHIDELTAAPGGRTASIATLRPLVEIEHADGATHYGGQIQFGPDGYLYASTGDGGGADGQYHHAQDPGSRLGKILRIDPDSGAASVWSSGLRNPFRFSFDSLSGDMVIGDVGQGLREEIDLAPSPLPGVVGGLGANYGWNCLEGSVAGPPAPAQEDECATLPAGGFAEPVFDYPQTAFPGGGEPCAVIGGYVVRDRGLGDLYGRYLYGDLCLDRLRSLNLANPYASDRAEDVAVSGLNSFGQDSCGRIYVVEASGRVSRLAGPAPAPDCRARALPAQPVSGRDGAPTFVGIKPQRWRVERGKVALLTVWVSPCQGHRGDTVALLRNGHRNGSKFLSRACTARFLARVRRNTTFRAIAHANDDYAAGSSRVLRIRVKPRTAARR